MNIDTEPQILAGRYELEKALRTDLFGATWRAIDTRELSKVDVRVLPPGIDRATVEAAVGRAAGISHPGIVSTIGFEEDGDTCVIVTEAFDGETMLQRRLRRPRRHFEVSEIKPWLRNISEALSHLHEKGVVHGGLHMGGFLIEGTELKITDLATASLQLPGPEGGSLLPVSSMSPRVLDGNPPEPADDVYALAAMMYDLLTGQPVFFSGDIVTQVRSVEASPIRDRRHQLEITSANFPQPWEDWIAAALAKDPAARPSLASLAELLQSGQANLPVTKSKTSRKATTAAFTPATSFATSAEKGRGISGNHLILGGALAAAIAMVAGVYFLHARPRAQFKGELDAAFQSVRASAGAASHDSAIEQWQRFETEWEPKVSASQPGFLPVIAAAKAARTDREVSLQRETERIASEKQERRNSYLRNARSDFEIARSNALGLRAKPEEVAGVWQGYLTKFDVPFEEGPRPAELDREISEAMAGLKSADEAVALRKKQEEELVAATRARWAEVLTAINDPTLSAAIKVRRVEDFVSSCGAHPLLKDMAAEATTKLDPLRDMAEKETPKEPLDVNGIFANSLCKDFSENGKKRVLMRVQEGLKASGSYEGPSDGGTGPMTHEAIIAFQKEKGLIPSAALDAATLAALNLGEIADDPKPFPQERQVAKATNTNRNRGKKKPQEEKGLGSKITDGAKKAGSAVRDLFR